MHKCPKCHENCNCGEYAIQDTWDVCVHYCEKTRLRDERAGELEKLKRRREDRE